MQGVVYEYKEGQKAREKREELLFGGEKEHIFVRRFPGFALSYF